MITPGAALLAEAAETVLQREGAHGDKGNTFRMIAAMWSAYLGADVSPADVAQMMVLLKVARARCGDRTHADHYVDQAGYVARTAGSTPRRWKRPAPLTGADGLLTHRWLRKARDWCPKSRGLYTNCANLKNRSGVKPKNPQAGWLKNPLPGPA